MAKMVQIVSKPRKTIDPVYKPVKWSFVAHGARYTRDEAQEFIDRVNHDTHVFRFLPC